MNNSKFKGSMIAKSEKEVRWYMAVSLACGYAVSIFPLEEHTYRIEIFEFDEEDA